MLQNVSTCACKHTGRKVEASMVLDVKVYGVPTPTYEYSNGRVWAAT